MNKKQIVDPSQRRTSNYLNANEFAPILSTLSLLISNNDKIVEGLEIDQNMNPEDIILQLIKKKIPIVIQREIEKNVIEDWYLYEMIIQDSTL